MKAMETLQSIVTTDRCTYMENFDHLMEKLVRPLTTQLTDLRSAITREASKVI
jgi:hypothetical protein